MTAEELRAFALSMPEAEERETWGDLTFRVRNKIFVVTSGDPPAASVKASPVDQQALIDMDPSTFLMSSYVGRFGWVTVQLASVEPDIMRELVVDAWRRTAPKRLAAVFDAAQ